ncbi:MAG TPA: acetyl-CoA carboxylase, carboxyltransferase subunit beta [Nitrospinota bacterium]|jgi:acetyl-CoA carboxylase carboxyl transferase subunit beta|nr:acetyl-CoA carboxylase, carboxyltransferase subunit beta [Nitrospinota bacterium]|tara:strand:+ start:22662 stop:23516 length:855 start_codon:yes stop_codon:yes gene_type:complete
MGWFTKVKKPLESIAFKKRIPEGVWCKCKGCKEIIYHNELVESFGICPKCSHHHRISASERIRLLIDDATFEEKDANVTSADPLKFRDTKKYKERLGSAQKKTGLSEGVISGSGLLESRQVEIAVMEFDFMGGSMGSAVGEKITRTIERGVEGEKPVILVSCSGGARMQEGLLSLMQMAKTSAALGVLAEKKLPYLSILSDPVSGGVTASFAMLGDVIISEPNALICFAGPRVIAQTIGETLPEGFQRAEFLLDHGFVDMVVPRLQLKLTVAQLLDFFCGEVAY